MLAAILASGALAACSNVAHDLPGDPPADAGAPTALGDGLRIRQINGPDSAVVNNQPNVFVTGAQYIIKDEYSETGLPSAVGDTYVQDFSAGGDGGGAPPYSGMLLYKPTLVPASLQLAPGDVIDFTGTYQQYASSSFPSGQFQPEIDEPIVTFRLDYSPPTPTVIPISDLASYVTGFQWMSMLVTVHDTVGGGGSEDGEGRNTIFLTSDTGQDGVTMDNELFALPWNLPQFNPDAGTVHFRSVTGVVTYFVSFHISPRSWADIEIEGPDGGLIQLPGADGGVPGG
jgi:hypothetical protein